MKIGITGTREGMNATQLQAVRQYLSDFPPGTEFHHGDCAGVDVQAAEIAAELGFHVVCHPPTSNELRAFHKSNEFREPLGYLKRDRNIVEATDQLLVVPLHNTWQSKGGTWYTHDYATKAGKPKKMFWPDGRT